MMMRLSIMAQTTLSAALFVSVVLLVSVAAGCGQRDSEPAGSERVVSESEQMPVGSDQMVETPAQTTTERDSVRVFWENYREATRLRQAGDYESAIRGYEAALEQNPSHGDALYYLGNASLELGLWEKAHETWARLVDVDPGSIRGHAQLGGLYLCRPQISTFNLTEAESAFEQANALNPGETGPVLRLAEIALFTGRNERASVLLADVLGQDESNLEALFFRAYMAWNSSRLGPGLAELNEVLSRMEVEPVGPIAGEGDTDATGGGGPAYAAGAACPIIDDFVREMRVAGSPVQAEAADSRFAAFKAQISALPTGR